VPAQIEQNGVQVVPKINGPDIAVTLDDPPMGGVDALFSQDSRAVRLLYQSVDPCREDFGPFEVGARSETQARSVLMGTRRPLITRREP
jgi:hypothetical protein